MPSESNTLRCASLLVLLCLLPGAAAQSTANWTLQTPQTSPLARTSPALAYDAAHGQVVLFGGIDSNINPFADTWLWDGTNWTKQSPKTSPSARWTHAMVYDSVHHQVVLFGGQSMTSSPILNDTWVWDGSNWTQMNPQTNPPARYGHVMVFDATHGQVVMFGGVTVGTSAPDLNDTWTWDGANWTKQPPPSSPQPRLFAGAAFDSAHGQMVLFGGHSNETGNDFGDTWTWDGANWAQKTPATNPAARETHAMAFDAAHGQAIFFGGSVTNNLDNGTWTWDGANWTQQSPPTSPPARSAYAMAYDAGHSQVVMFAGYAGSYVNETWIWNGGSVGPVPAVNGAISLVTPAAANVHVGDSLLYELDLSNTGNVAITNLALNDSNPTGGLAFDQPTFGSCTVAPPGFNCTGLANLAINASAKYTFTATATGAGVVTDAVNLAFNSPPQTFAISPLNITVQPAAGQPTFTALSMPWRAAFTPNSAVVKADGVIATDLPFPFDPTIAGGIFALSPQDATATALGLPVTVYPAVTLVSNLAGNGPNDIVILDSTQSTAFIVLNVAVGSAPSFSSASGLTGFASPSLAPSSVAAFQDPNTGFTDLAIIDTPPPNTNQPGEIVVATNDGTGNFGNFVYYSASPLAGNPIGMDFNNDGLQDLAFLDPAGNNIVAMLSSASGFGNPVLTSLGGATPIAMAAGDFNGDGFTDLAVLTPAGVNIFYGVGDGTFSSGPKISVADGGPITRLQPGLLAVADFNGDGNLDLAVASPASNRVTILSGDGQGNFGTPAPYAAANPIALAAGTLAGTSYPSLVVINGPSGSTPGNVSIFAASR